MFPKPFNSVLSKSVFIAIMFVTACAENNIAQRVSPLHLAIKSEEYLGSRVVVTGFIKPGTQGGLFIFQTEKAAELDDTSQAIPLDVWNISESINFTPCVNQYVRVWARYDHAKIKGFEGEYRMLTKIESVWLLKKGELQDPYACANAEISET